MDRQLLLEVNKIVNPHLYQEEYLEEGWKEWLIGGTIALSAVLGGGMAMKVMDSAPKEQQKVSQTVDIKKEKSDVVKADTKSADKSGENQKNDGKQKVSPEQQSLKKLAASIVDSQYSKNSKAFFGFSPTNADADMLNKLMQNSTVKLNVDGKYSTVADTDVSKFLTKIWQADGFAKKLIQLSGADNQNMNTQGFDFKSGSQADLKKLTDGFKKQVLKPVIDLNKNLASQIANVDGMADAKNLAAELTKLKVNIATRS